MKPPAFLKLCQWDTKNLPPELSTSSLRMGPKPFHTQRALQTVVSYPLQSFPGRPTFDPDLETSVCQWNSLIGGGVHLLS